MLMSCCGSVEADLDQVLAVRTPDPTDTHFPTPHGTLIQCVERELQNFGYTVRQASHTLSHEGMSYFGLLELESDISDYSYVAGLRNDHEKRFAQGFACGMHVLVCDNLSFSGDVVVKRKHTRFALDQLPSIVHEGIKSLDGMRIVQDQRVEAYKASDLDDMKAHDMIVKSIDAGAISASKVPAVLQEWREPKHVEFAPRNVWSLFNAYTEVYKSGSLDLMHAKSQKLHSLVDNYLGLAS